MTNKLLKLLKEAKKSKMSEDEQEAQRQSFAYGNTHIENENVTRETVSRVAKRMSDKG